MNQNTTQQQVENYSKLVNPTEEKPETGTHSGPEGRMGGLPKQPWTDLISSPARRNHTGKGHPSPLFKG